MWQRTYDRHFEEYLRLDELCALEMMGTIARLTGKLADDQSEIIRELMLVTDAIEREGGEEELLLEIEDSGIRGELRIVLKQIKDGKFSAAAENSRKCARMMESWAKEISGS